MIVRSTYPITKDIPKANIIITPVMAYLHFKVHSQVLIYIITRFVPKERFWSKR
jgi:hypothetical protein